MISLAALQKSDIEIDRIHFFLRSPYFQSMKPFNVNLIMHDAASLGACARKKITMARCTSQKIFKAVVGSVPRSRACTYTQFCLAGTI